MLRIILATTLAITFALPQSHAAEPYLSLSRAVVVARVSPDLLGTTEIDPKPFAQCFKAEGLTVRDLKAAIHGRSLDRRITRCFDKLIGL